jgi:DNA-binding NarL/FixJ family response regulator
VIKELMTAEINSKILVLTMHESKELPAKVESLGASGYVTKTSAARDLVRAIQVIFNGGTFFPSQPARSATKRPNRNQIL